MLGANEAKSLAGRLLIAVFGMFTSTVNTRVVSNGVYGPAGTKGGRPAEQLSNERQTEQNLLATILEWDVKVTNWICICSHPKTQLQRLLKLCCMTLELSGHGVPWFVLAFTLLLLHFFNWDDVYWIYGRNMLAILIVDILVVAPVKLIVKRPRPSLNNGDIPLSVSSVDVYAFPSGHASRSVALAVYFCYMPPFNPWTHLWYIWAFLVSLSRVVIGRHHVTDIAVGTLAGYFIFGLAIRFGLLTGL